MRPLSDTRIRILKRLASGHLERAGSETAREIAVALGIDLSTVGAALITFDCEGLAEHVGWIRFNARTWTITDAGRSALAEAEKAE